MNLIVQKRIPAQGVLKHHTFCCFRGKQRTA